MNKQVWVILILLFLLATSFCFAQNLRTQNPGNRRIIVVSDFYYDGEVWSAKLGNYIAEKVRQRVYSDYGNYFTVLPVNEANELLINNGIAYAWGSSPEKISKIFFKRGASIAVIGKIDKIIQTADVDGSAELKIQISVSLYDVASNSGIKTFETENVIRIDKKIRENTPWDIEIARKMIVNLAFKVSAHIENEMRRLRRNRGTLTI